LTFVEVRGARFSERERWNAFVTSGASPAATFFHLWEWADAVEEAHGHAAHRFVAEVDGEIVGVLPLNDVRSILSGRSFISGAFAVGGGVAATSAAVADALATSAIDTARDAGAHMIEMRSETAAIAGWNAKTPTHETYRKAIVADEDARLQAIPRKRRAEVRKAIAMEASGDVRVRFDGSVETFYRLYARSLRSLGTPVFSRRFAETLAQKFSDRMCIALVEVRGEAVAALMSFYFRGAVMPYYIGASPQARAYRAFDLIYWRLMEQALSSECEIFDFGRSKIGSPHAAYKKSWGFEPVPLAYQYCCIRGERPVSADPASAKFRAASAVWKKLPLPLTNALGPLVARHLP